MNCNNNMKSSDYGPYPFSANIEMKALQNRNFRTALWTGCNLQMTVMCIPTCDEIGLEIHMDTDQFIRVEEGQGMIKMGLCKNQWDYKKHLCKGDGVFVPAGTWHNIINTGRCPLKLSSIYAPPKHPRGTVQRTKADAEAEEY